MKTETIKKLDDFLNNKIFDVSGLNGYKRITTILPAEYIEFLNMYNGGEGRVGENSYLQLWSFQNLIELNKDNEVLELLSGIVLIGNDGGDTAYGINQKGKYIKVPLIGLNVDDFREIANNFDEFIEYVYNL